MGMFSWLWEWFNGWFSGDTRHAEEKMEAWIEKKERIITSKEETMEKYEEEMLKIIKKELEEFNKLLRTSYIPNVNIQSGSQSINLDQCVQVLMQYVNVLLKNKVSLRQEMQMVQSIRNYWIATRHGISSVISQLRAAKDGNADKKIKKVTNLVSAIDGLFKEFSTELTKEEALSEEKLRLINQQYSLMVKEEGSSKAAAPAGTPLKPAVQRA